MNRQKCHCGWSKVMTYEELKIHQEEMGCTATAASYPDKSLQECHCGWSKVTTYHGLKIHQGKMRCTPKGEGIQKTEPLPNTHTITAEISCKIKLEYEPLPAPPPRSSQTDTIPNSGRQLQDSSTGVQENRLVREQPTFPPQAEVVRPRQKDWRDPKSSEVRQDRIRDNVKHEIQMREQQVAQARSSVKANEGTSEAELLEITSVFSDVVRIAEDAKRKSLDRPFSTLRTTTSTMMEQIQQKLDKLAVILDVELDPTTAYECLVSPDGKRLSNRAGTQGARQRFGNILGRNRLTSGKSYWEVEVGNQTGWSLGVATGDAQHITKGRILLCPENGYWVAEHYENKFAALTNPPVGLPLKEKPQKVGVFVDYEEGLVSFYDVTAQSLIYSFTECSFTEGIYPYFLLHLKEDGSADPLIIATVKCQ